MYPEKKGGDMSNYVYLRAESLKSEVRAKHKIKVDAKTRIDVVAVTGYYEPLQSLKNPKGMIYFNVIGTDGVINSSDRRRADVWLQSTAAGNISSVFILDLGVENEIIGYGYPSEDEYSKPKKTKLPDGTIRTKERPNPFCKYSNDGFMFIAKPDFSVIEIVVIQNGRYFIQSECKKYADGKMNDVLATLRAEARPIFQY